MNKARGVGYHSQILAALQYINDSSKVGAIELGISQF